MQIQQSRWLSWRSHGFNRRTLNSHSKNSSTTTGMASALPATRSWFPGHMSTFMRQLPALLAQTHVVLEVRDVRLPLTSINPHLEFALDKWKRSRASLSTASVCERIVVYTKRDLIDGGEEVGIVLYEVRMCVR